MLSDCHYSCSSTVLCSAAEKKSYEVAVGPEPSGIYWKGLGLGLGKSLFPVGMAKDQKLTAVPIATVKKLT